MLDAINGLIPVVNLALTVGVGVFAFFATRRKNVDHKLIDHDRRLQRVEDKLTHTPETREVHEILVKIEGMAGDVRVLSESLKGHGEIMRRIESIVGRHEDTLIGRGK